MPPTTTFNISPAMFVQSALDILKSFAEGRISSTRVFQMVELALAGTNEEYIPDDWLDLVEIVTHGGLVGFEEIKATLERNPIGDARSLRQDPAAWTLVRDWAAGVIEFPKLLEQLKTRFGGAFVENEWSGTFTAVFDASAPDSDDENLLATSGSAIPRPVRVVEEAMVSLGVALHAAPAPLAAPPSTLGRRRRSSNSDVHRPRKRRNAGSIFIDISAAESDEEEDEEEDEDYDGEVTGTLPSQQVQPAGQASYAKRLDQIVERYERGNQSRSLPQATAPQPLQLYRIETQQDKQIYIVEFLTPNIKTFCRTFIESRGLRCWDVARIPNKAYIEADSAHQIRITCPPSHTATMRSIVQVPHQDLPHLTPAHPSFRPRSWVRILRGIYKDDILGFLLSVENDNYDVLVVPRRRPYDKIDKDDIQEIKEHKRQERKLFDESEARQAGCQVVPFNRNTGIWMCKNSYYHRGLLRHSFARSSLQVVEAPHPDRIALHVEARVDQVLIERTHLLFSSAFWQEGDLVRSTTGTLGEQGAKIISVALDQGIVTVQPFESDVPECVVPIVEVRRLFKQGDSVKILAGRHRGSAGTVLIPGEIEVNVLLESKDMAVIPWPFLETYMPSRIWSLVTNHTGLEISSAAPPQREFDEIMQGDRVSVTAGNYRGSDGFLDSKEGSDWIWVKIHAEEQWRTVLLHLDEVKIFKPQNTLRFTKEHGYDVTVGDVLQVVRGERCGVSGIVRTIDFIKAEVGLMLEANGSTLTIPIPLCTRVVLFSAPRGPVGRDVWIIRGVYKGFRATLRAVNRTTSVVSFAGHHSLEVKNSDLATEQCILLNGTPLEGTQLTQLQALIARSFRPETPPPVHATPPPSPRATSALVDSESDAWKVTAADREVDKGTMEWLFDNAFCDFSRYQLAFNVSAGYGGGNYVKRVVRTTCPDRFANHEGQAPEGCVSVTVTGNHTGNGVEHHFIPARFLTPASPVAKGQLVLVLRGDLQGQICHVIRWVSRKEKKAVLTPFALNKSFILPASDLCLAYLSV